LATITPVAVVGGHAAGCGGAGVRPKARGPRSRRKIKSSRLGLVLLKQRWPGGRAIAPEITSEFPILIHQGAPNAIGLANSRSPPQTARPRVASPGSCKWQTNLAG